MRRRRRRRTKSKKRRRRKCGGERPEDPRNTVVKVSFLAQLC